MPIPRTETFSVYQSSEIVGTDKNPVPADAALVVADLKLNIHRGNPQAVQEAWALGVDATAAAIGYANVVDAGYYKHLRMLINDAGEAWLIVARPAVRNRFPATAHVRLLLTQILSQVPGLPMVVF